MNHVIKCIVFIISLFVVSQMSAQNFSITTFDRTKIHTTLIDSTARVSLLDRYKAEQKPNLKKSGTARTYLLSDGRVVIEFFDRQGLLISNIQDFEKLNEVKFVKNRIWLLKKNISYKIELTPEQANHILNSEKPERLSFESEVPAEFTIDVFQLRSGEILFMEKDKERQWTTLFPDLKTSASSVWGLYGQYHQQFLSEKAILTRLKNGDPLDDFEIKEHLVYPNDVGEIVQAHGLVLIESNIHVSEFRSNLYRSSKGYFVLIDDPNQIGGSGEKLQILSLSIHESIDEVKARERNYHYYKNNPRPPEHFYKQVSDQYGQDFIQHVPSLISKLTEILNLDPNQISTSNGSIPLIDDALSWVAKGDSNFDQWFPSILAYFGEYHIQNKPGCRWKMTFDPKGRVWIPEVILPNGNPAFDSNDFYKSMLEGPIPMDWMRP